MFHRQSRRSIVVVPALSCMLLALIGLAALAQDPPVTLTPAWELSVANHGGGSVDTGERWTVIGGPQYGPGVMDDEETFELRDYLVARSEPNGEVVEKLTGSDTEAGDRLGYSVATSGDRIAGGAPSAEGERGAVYVFTIEDGMVLEHKILPAAGDGNGFGSAVDLDGTRLAVATFDGDVSVFDLVEGSWVRTRLPAGSQGEGSLGLGVTVALQGDTLAVGRPGVGDSGIVDVYTEEAEGWAFEPLEGSDLDTVFGAPGFGASVDVAGSCVIAGAPNTFVGAGYMGGVYAFCRSGQGWTEAKLTVPQQTNDDGFGTAVTMLGSDYAVVGAPKQDEGAYNSGSVFVFTREDRTWRHVETLTTPAAHLTEEGGFGTALAIGWGRLVVGAAGPPEPSADGMAFAYRGPYQGAFWDDDGLVFEPDIEWLAEAGITKGCNPPDNTRFCPDGLVTRGQMAAFLNRALNLPEAEGDSFVDDDGSIFESDIEALAAAGITKGCNPPDNTRFCPTDPVTRAQMAAFLHRAAPLLP